MPRCRLLLGQVKGIAIALGIVKVCWDSKSCDRRLTAKSKRDFFNGGWWLTFSGRDHPTRPTPYLYFFCQCLPQKRRHRLKKNRSSRSLAFIYIIFFLFSPVASANTFYKRQTQNTSIWPEAITKMAKLQSQLILIEVFVVSVWRHIETVQKIDR